MPIVSRIVFQAVRWRTRRGLLDEATVAEATGKERARQAGVRGETYAYWYLRRQGYIFIARNYMPNGVKGEIDLIGYDGQTLVFVEVRTRTVREKGISGLPELSVTPDKQYVVVRAARRFLAQRRLTDCPVRFDVVAIDNQAGQPPVVRLHKDAFSPQM